ncbi:MAG TPA: acetyl-CoA carboxylase biotin carboxyl carrier protein, partial [Deltaproteobacteria bacterium]|nr:acetyl-CoA carboxylase biotin carboxyl carrier protein [Deltaproteobacteria bacterium]
MNVKEIREILELLKGTDVSELEVSRGENVLKVRRGAVLEPRPLPASRPASEPPQPPPAPAAPPKPETPPKAAAKEVVSPIVGTFYR